MVCAGSGGRSHNEVGQVGQLRTCEKSYETGNLANLANFFSITRWASMTRRILRIERRIEWNLHRPKITPDSAKSAKLANFEPATKPTKQGT